jgi:4a-hydroxytetrahydrobiopterin dehydratase
MDLASKRCIPCEGGTPPLFKPQAEALLKEVSGWSLSPDAKSISKQFKFKNFAEALAFANKIGAIAEAENHHPDLTLSWGKVGVALSTHSIGGLSENDFILAAKIDAVS